MVLMDEHRVLLLYARSDDREQTGFGHRHTYVCILPRLYSQAYALTHDSSEYRSAIFYTSSEQKEVAEQVTQDVQKLHFDPKGQKIVTEILPAGQWYNAEDYHQEYLFNNPDGYQCPTHKEHW